MGTQSRGLLLRGAGGSRSALVVPFAIGVVDVDCDFIFTVESPVITVSTDFLFSMEGGASASLVCPWILDGPIERRCGFPFSILDDTTGVDDLGYIIAPLVGLYELEPGEVR
jgi:hypothetical protein